MTIYFIQAGPDGPIKIGFTTSLSRRLQDIGNSLPMDITLLNAMNGCTKTERQLHARFAGDCIKGEWFHPSETLLGYIAALGPYEPSASRLRRFVGSKRVCKEPSLACSKCGKRYDDIAWLLSHFKRVHGKARGLAVIFDDRPSQVRMPLGDY